MAALCAAAVMTLATQTASAAGCRFEAQGDGRVADIIDVRTFRLHDGREVRLMGIEPIAGAAAAGASALAVLIAGREVSLHGDSDMPDRYGRQLAFAYLASGNISVQARLLAQGMALASGVVDNECAAQLAAAETGARRARRGHWASDVIKNAESPGDILADVGRFAVVEGKVVSVRQAGGTTYINFGRNWTQDFAVTISRRMMAAFEAAGVAPKSFERRRIRVRGFVERRGGPRIELLRVGQIEVVGDN